MKTENFQSNLAAFNPIDRHFAALMARLTGGDPAVELAAALVSHGRSLGHICVDLTTFTPDALPPELRDLKFPKPAAWLKQLRKAAVVGRPGEFKPLILDDANRLYLHRYWQYEFDLAASLRRRAAADAENFPAKATGEKLARLFPAIATGETDWQKVAAFAAARKNLCVISGGPGTGKTRTAVLLLALLLEQADDARLRIALCAPTGKAAARLQETVKKAKASLPCTDAIKARLPEEAKTIHRLLGAIPDSAFFRHNAENPLPLEVVVVDEASMVDLALMAKLVAAVPLKTRLILLGDKDQLASVEAGAVLADICNTGAPQTYSKKFLADFSAATGETISGETGAEKINPLADSIVELRKNYRFSEHSPIAPFSRAVNTGNATAALKLLADAAAGAPLFCRATPEPAALKAALKPVVLENYRACLRAENPAAALKAFGQFRILCALRGGPYGVENVNRLVAEILAEAGLIAANAENFAGRPVLVTRNDYHLGLFNGDIGMVLADGGELRAFFPGAENQLRKFLPLRLPEHETAFAMTVHKSQGSEFERVLFILPRDDSPVLTRELVYTGLTRASAQVELWAGERLLRTAVERPTRRRSGLRDALWPSP